MLLVRPSFRAACLLLFALSCGVSSGCNNQDDSSGAKPDPATVLQQETRNLKTDPAPKP